MRAEQPTKLCKPQRKMRVKVGPRKTSLTRILRIGDQVPTFDVFWPKHLQEVRSTVNAHAQSM